MHVPLVYIVLRLAGLSYRTMTCLKMILGYVLVLFQVNIVYEIPFRYDISYDKLGHMHWRLLCGLMVSHKSYNDLDEIKKNMYGLLSVFEEFIFA